MIKNLNLTLAALACMLVVLTGCLGSGGGGGSSAANTAPVANAGAIQNITVGTHVTLNGSASTDANGDTLTYNWTLTTKPTGSTATLVSATTAAPTFTADLAGTYVATLIVNDGAVDSTAATITVTAAVGNSAPVANAGTAQNVTTGFLVTLDGSASTDANGDTLTYNWTLTTKPTGSTVTLVSATTAAPTFTADLAGTYVVTLIVNDGLVNSTPATVSINATAWSGIKQLGVAGAVTQALSIATDAGGNVYVAGFTYGGLDGNTLTGTQDFFLTKYSSSGTKLYTKQLGAAGANTGARSVATDASGNVYVAGETTGGLDGNPLNGTRDFFLTKYDSSGTKLYTKQLGVAGANTTATSVATDAGGNVYVGGETSGGLDGNPLNGTKDFFLTKYDSSGTKLYTKQLGVAGANTLAYSVATDTSGNVYVAGGTTGGLDGNTLTGGQDFFLTKYNSSGTRIYTKQLGVTGASTTARSVATDASGNVYVAGYTNGGLDGNTLTGTGDFFLTKYDSSGTRINTKHLGVAGALTQAFSVATDASGNVYVAGHTYGGLDGNTLSGPPGTTTDFFLTKYNSSGTRIYTKQLGVTGANTNAYSVATDTGGNVFVAGLTNGGLGSNTLTGTYDFFIAKFSVELIGGVLQ